MHTSCVNSTFGSVARSITAHIQHPHTLTLSTHTLITHTHTQHTHIQHTHIQHTHTQHTHTHTRTHVHHCPSRESAVVDHRPLRSMGGKGWKLETEPMSRCARWQKNP